MNQVLKCKEIPKTQIKNMQFFFLKSQKYFKGNHSLRNYFDTRGSVAECNTKIPSLWRQSCLQFLQHTILEMKSTFSTKCLEISTCQRISLHVVCLNLRLICLIWLCFQNINNFKINYQFLSFTWRKERKGCHIPKCLSSLRFPCLGRYDNQNRKFFGGYFNFSGIL